ncbi:EI24 domain-containing protein [Sphingomonas sp.]|uniref:EI24 domain-containing protein n=1 Tax=Sphingomonas sp. TaxID=28214 RepID=UPI001B08B8EB|nr:EI24 domain-containing protein [Sphingomonas sp.]MBO9714504.1 EI24 domain-containing protein [Sphingomonas sp.]
MIQAFFLSLGDLFDMRVAGVFLKSLLLTLLLFAGLGVGLYFGLHWAAAQVFGAGYGSGAFADIVTIVVIIFAHWLLFRAIAIAVVGIFADEVVEAVEKRRYPAAFASVRKVPFHRSLAMGLRSGLRAIGYNILFSPLYLVANFAAPVVFFVVNAWLLGKDFGDMVAVRHMPEADLPQWRRRTRLRRLGVGAVGTALLLVPVVNLIAPILGAAMAAHAFHQGRRA